MNRIQTEIFLGTLLFFLTSAVILGLGLGEQKRMAQFTVSQNAREIEVGAVLYETNCSRCHGVKGEGTLGLCPPLNDAHFFTGRLTEVGWSGTLEDYIVATVASGRLVSTRPEQYIGQGRPAMPAWSEQYGGPLRTDQIRSIATFIMNWQSTALGEYTLETLPTPTISPEEANDPVARGKRVFLTSGCTGCHTIDGLSVGTVGPNLTHIATTAATRIPSLSTEEYIRQSILNPGAHLVEGFQDLMPKNFGQLLNQQQLDDLVAFMLTHE